MKKIMKKVTLIIAFVVIVASILGGITNAKYVSQITGDGQLDVARWNFTVNGQSKEIQTIRLADTYDKSTLINGKIAPGTSGSFDLVIDASLSEVGVEYDVNFGNQINKPSNLKFKYQGKELDGIEAYEQYFTGIIQANDTNKTRTLTVEWEWPYETENDTSTIEENDEIDTNDGIQALNYIFDVVVTGTQVIPQEQ